MVQWASKQFGGEIPRSSPRALPDDAAEFAFNTDLLAGPLNGLPKLQQIADLTAHAFPVKRAYRFPVMDDPTDVWLALPDVNCCVARSPVANDAKHRLYWTIPGQGAFWLTRDDIRAGAVPWNLGFTTPDISSGVSPLTVTASGGTPPETLAYIERSYAYTFVSSYDEESAPSLPSATVAGAIDGTWQIAGLPTADPGPPAGKHYPPVVSIWLYRTITSASQGTQFYRVQQYTLAELVAAGGTVIDSVSDSTALNLGALLSENWSSPIDNLDGLVQYPGGMLIGFTGNTLHFCEPNRPHTWPVAYDISVGYSIVSLAVWQQNLVILTKGFPSLGSGNTPGNFTTNMLAVPEPCIARNSVIVDLLGVYYASQNGIVMINYYGALNQTLKTMTKNIWLTEYLADNIIACRHRTQYLAINGTGTGFIIDYVDPRLGVIHISNVDHVECVWNDVWTGDAYMAGAGIIYRWDDPTTPQMTYRWRSKQWFLPAPTNLAAVQISMDPPVTVGPFSASAPEQDFPDDRDHLADTVTLPAGAYALFRLFADGVEVYHKYLTNRREIFRLPSGFKTFLWQYEVISNVSLHSIEVASTMKELTQV